MKTILLFLGLLTSVALCDADRMFLQNGKEIVSARAAWQAFHYTPLKVEHTIGQRRAIFGVVEKLARDPDGNPYMLLVVPDELGSVRCVFGPADADSIRNLELGSRVIVEGTVKGMTLSILSFTGCKFTR